MQSKNSINTRNRKTESVTVKTHNRSKTVLQGNNTERTVSRKSAKAAANQITRVYLDKSGRIVLPAAWRRSLDLKPGDPVTITLEEDALRIRSVKAALKAARELMRKRNTGKRSLVDELIAERRAEADRE